MNWLKNPRYYLDGLPAVGLLFLRIFAGYALAQHGMGKIATPFSWMGPDAPVPGILQALAAASEFFGGIALIFGVLTPLACLGIMSTMFVASLAVAQRPGAQFLSPAQPNWELSAAYFVVALTLFLTGPGVLSVDHFVFGRKKTVETAT